jgi:hypothetical protein
MYVPIDRLLYSKLSEPNGGSDVISDWAEEAKETL